MLRLGTYFIPKKKMKNLNKETKMGKFLLKTLGGVIVPAIIKKLNTTGFKQMIVHTVNKQVDIPKLNEKQEQQLLMALLDAIVAYLK